MIVEVDYYSFSPSLADANWHFFVEDLEVLRNRASKKDSFEQIEVNERQKKLYNFSAKSLVHKKFESDEELIKDLIRADIVYGSCSSDYLDSQIETVIVPIILETLGMSKKDIFDKNDLLKVFQEINSERIGEIIKKVRSNLKCDFEIAKKEVVGYLQAIKPVVENLKNTPDSLFIREADCSIEPIELLRQRAKEKLEEHFILLRK